MKGLLAAALALASIALLFGVSGAVPLTWDEAFNFLHVSSRGPVAAFTTYEAPNNHVLFSALQALLPAAWIAHWPPVLRLWNVLVAAGVGALLAFALRGQRFAPLLAVLLALCAPVSALYLVVARGYLLGTLCLLGALALRDRPGRAGLLAGLSLACVPTFLLALPGLALALRAGRLRAALACGAVALVSYAGIFRQVLRQRELWGSTPQRFLESFFGQQWPSLLLLAVALALAAPQLRHAPRHAVALISSGAGFLLLAPLLAFLGILDAPYARNALFAPLFLWLGALLGTTGRARTAVAGCLALSAALVAAGLLSGLRDPNRIPFLRELTPTPLQRSLGLPFDALAVPDASLPLGQLYARGKPVLPLRETPRACGAGAIEPEPLQEAVLLGGGAPLRLCY